MSGSTRQNCLIILSSSPEGVCAQSFIQAFTLTHTTFNVQVATPQARYPEFVDTDDSSRRWLTEFKAKAYSTPIALDSVDEKRYSAVLVPHCLGAAYDLVNSSDVAHILQHFLQQRKVICVIGMGVCSLFSLFNKDTWEFQNYNVTGSTLEELVRLPSFGKLPVIPQDFVLSHRGRYCSSDPDVPHVAIDRHVISSQNGHGTLTAVQNLILLCNQKKK